MTVLDKIKRCVSLVWDFQEVYDEEDIQDFRHNELCTYSQHDEIMECFKRIENLEKENAELEAQIEKMKCCQNCEGTCSSMFGEQRECWKCGVPTKWRLKVR